MDFLNLVKNLLHNMHVVVVIGFGPSNGDDYWIVKNCYVDSLGMNGRLSLKL